MKQKINLYKNIVWLAISFFSHSAFAENVITSVKSPDGSITLNVLLDESIASYEIFRNTDLIVEKSKLQINTSIGDFSTGLAFISTSSNAIDETYSLPSGKKSSYVDECNEIKAVFDKSGKQLEIVFRVYDDGVAYRYTLAGSGNLSILSESSECIIPEKKKIYAQTYSRDYKNPFEEKDWSRMGCINNSSLPVLIETTNNYALLSEAMVNGNYSGAKLSVNELTGAFVFQLNGNVTTALPFKSPWRTLMIGSLETIVESTILDNLNETRAAGDITWIKPGRAAWNYGGEDTSDYLNLNNIRTYIDWANEMGWEYFTLDRGWQNSRRFTLNQVINYANSKSVGVFIWVNQSFLPDNETQMRTTLQGWKNQGVKGLKVDFWESDSQSMMKKYDLLLRIALEQKLLLNFHSGTKPTGLRRTWPHLLTSESVSGNIYYARNPEVITSSHNINSAIIRNSLGATDYAPVDFADKNGRLLQSTTWAHQLALSVVFESGIQHIMESPDNLRYNISKDFLSTLPVSWDDTRCLEAIPEEYVSIARRKNDDWYLASLTNEARTVEIPLGFLSSDKTYNAYIYKDGESPSEITFEYKEGLKSNDKITLSILNNGGFAICLSPSSNYSKPVFQRYEAESSDNIIPFGVPVKIDEDSLCSGNKYVASIGKGRSLTFQKITVPQTATYALTFYYMSDSHCSAYIKVNGNSNTQQECVFANTGKESGSGLAHKTIFVELDAAIENTIEFGNDTDYAPNLDRITIAKHGEGYTGIESIEEYKEYKIRGNVYTNEKNIIIEQESETNYTIYNSLGQPLQKGYFGGGVMSVPVSNSGIYIVRMQTGQLEISEKVIIK